MLRTGAGNLLLGLGSQSLTSAVTTTLAEECGSKLTVNAAVANEHSSKSTQVYCHQKSTSQTRIQVTVSIQYCSYRPS